MADELGEANLTASGTQVALAKGSWSDSATETTEVYDETVRYDDDEIAARYPMGNATNIPDTVGGFDGTHVTGNSSVSSIVAYNGNNATEYNETLNQYGTLPLPQFPNSFSISFWWKSNGTTPDLAYILCAMKRKSDNWPNIYFEHTGTAVTLYVNDTGAAADNADATYTDTLTTNKLYHMVGTYDGTTATLYVNNVQTIGTNTGGDMVYWDPTSEDTTLSVWASDYLTDDSGGSFFDVRIYHKTLTSTEVDAIYRFYEGTFDTITEGFDLSDIMDELKHIEKVVNEGVLVNDIQLIDVLLGIIEHILLGDTVTAEKLSNISIVEGVKILDDVFLTMEALAAEGIDLSDILSEGVAVSLLALEALAIGDPILTNIIANNDLVELLAIIDALHRYTEAIATEQADFSDILLNSLIATYIQLDEVLVTDTLAASLSVILPALEGVTLDDTSDTNAILQNTLDEGIIFVTQFIYDGTLYTGWVMNSENFAVTNYSNYDFTSFGKFNGNYYGIKPEGLFLLEGNMDEASYINAIIKTAVMDLDTSNLKAIPQAYFGFTGDGEMVLKIMVDDDTETWYNMISTSDGIHSQRLKLSKGLQGRYWQFELTSQNNTTLELDTIELYPIVLKRKL